MKTVVLYIRNTYAIGGIETFIFNFSRIFRHGYEITVWLRDHYDERYVNKLREATKVLTGPQDRIECDTLIMCRVLDPIPEEIKYKKVIRRIHTLKACGVLPISATLLAKSSLRMAFALLANVLLLSHAPILRSTTPNINTSSNLSRLCPVLRRCLFEAVFALTI